MYLDGGKLIFIVAAVALASIRRFTFLCVFVFFPFIMLHLTLHNCNVIVMFNICYYYYYYYYYYYC